MQQQEYRRMSYSTTMYSITVLICIVVYFLSSSAHGQQADKFFREDYTYIEKVKGFYKFHTDARTWPEAKKACATEGAFLWHPDNEKEANAVISFWKTTQPRFGFVYVGLSDTRSRGLWETTEGKSVSEVYTKWLYGVPTNYGGSRDLCVYIYSSGQMGEWDCTSRYNFICKKSLQSLEWNHQCNIPNPDGQMADKFFRKDYTYMETVKGFYKIHMDARTWPEAKQVCAMEGATLWHPDNEKEAIAVISFWNTTQPQFGYVYVGLSDTMSRGLWETTEGKLVSEVYNKWQNGMPNNYDGSRDLCVYIYNSGLMDDWDCTSSYHFICKKSLQSLEWNHQCNIPNPDYTFNEETGKCYRLHTTPLNWNDSYNVCRYEQSYLAVISNRQEADYLANLTESSPKPRVKGNYLRGLYHVGFHNKFNKGWQTVKGTPMNVDADAWFDDYQPDESDQCGSMFFNGRLINVDCDSKSFFICEHEPSNATLELEEHKTY